MSRHPDFTVLIVDDNNNNLFTLRTLIRTHMDTTVLEAHGGAEAIEIAYKDPSIDLIVLDIQMPEMDGFEAASMLKIRKRTRDIPIIFLTAAFKTEEFQRKGYELGAADYLLKPIDDNQLINKISTYFRLIEKERSLNRVLEEKVAERTAELRDANQRLENIIEYMGEALLVLSPDGKIEGANPASLRMLGYNEATLQGMSIGDIFEEQDEVQAGAFMGAWLEALIRSGAMSNIDARFITHDDRRIPILFSRTAILDEDDKVQNILCIAKDMSGFTRDP
ncbi:MAG TPA: response regulator [Chromatiaceae bacterium]|jgi:PAS domain S-box-containing protein|nr:response regulator [Chromatiaceae bacterium]HIA08433.1 response regulator [Chromatiaceae bacterium]HIN82508.1 response regulator [Chromatiales bacterium]HIO15007.1 response regulator [Chromatiales bacterium]HIO53791.1 response regulator [Chromatiales bacterium]